ncbi:MAG: hypothetical protein KC680_00980 [Candidatus Peregrinibacteria bacterium]|nr:hypothetical protein [Candidatus Peregrinibacteria bacterium]MCB9808110.1 hypothetical protein [Candidatus Peribacteria bacterium]
MDHGAEQEIQRAVRAVERTSTAEATGMEPHALPGGFVESFRHGVQNVLNGEEQKQAA